MICRNCGEENDAGFYKCVKCGEILDRAEKTPIKPAIESVNIPNYLVYAIFVTLLCFFPAGIVSIVYAARVNSKLAAGDGTGAEDASANAKKWCIISLLTGLAIMFICMTYYIMVGPLW